MIRYRAIGSYIELVRVKHWIKNLFVFAPLVFSLNLFSVEHFTKCLIAFFSFCCVSSAVYIINDLFDRERDRQHPHKKKRPIARRDISTAAAITISLFMLLLSIIFSVSLNPGCPATQKVVEQLPQWFPSRPNSHPNVVSTQVFESD